MGLVAHKDHGTLRSPQVVLQVVPNSAGVTHTGGGEDDLGGPVRVQKAALVGPLGEPQVGEAEELFAVAHLPQGILVQVAPQVPGEDPGGLLGQGAVQIDREVGVALDQALLLQLTDGTGRSC